MSKHTRRLWSGVVRNQAAPDLQLAYVTELAWELQVAQRRLVRRVRSNGETWDRVAELLGVTRSAAIQRFSDDVG